MDEMKELVTVEQAEGVIRLLAWLLPAAGVSVGAVVGALRRRLVAGVVTGLLLGLCGPLTWGLWRMYNAIMGRFGLDSVKGLLLNLAIFAILGLGIGAAVGSYCSRHRVATAQQTTSTEDS